MGQQLIKCSKCNTPLGVIEGNKFIVRLYKNGKAIKNIVEVAHDTGGSISITCGDCGFSFIRTLKNIPMSYAVIPKNKPGDKNLHS